MKLSTSNQPNYEGFISQVGRGLIAVFCFAIATISSITLANVKLSKTQQQWLNEHKIIRVCPDPHYAPLELIKDGRFQGISRDYLDIIASELDIQFVFQKENNWKTCYRQTLEKQNDILPLTALIPERRKLFAQTDPYITLKSAIVTRQNYTNQEMTIEDFYGKKIAVVDGYFWQEVLARDYPRLIQIPVESPIEALTAVAFGEVDATFINSAIVTYYIETYNISNLHIAGKTPYNMQFNMSIRDDWEEFAQIVNQTLASVSPKQKKKINQRWIKLSHYPSSQDKKVFGSILLIFLLVFTSAGLWVILLKRQVQHKTKQLQLANEQLEKKVLLRTHELELSNQKLEQLSKQDKTTQIANRRFLDDELEKIFINEQFPTHSITAFMIDIDFFKTYNDTYGHIKGDEALYQIAQTLQSLIKRENDILARFGGEEFTLICLDMSRAHSIQFANRILAEVRNLNIEHTASTIAEYLTISVGVATVRNCSQMTPYLLLEQADKALYQAKAKGRDGFVIFDAIDDAHE